MLSGRADPGESRMGETSMSGSTRERGAAVIDAIVFHSVLSSLLYWLKTSAMPAHAHHPVEILRFNTCGSVDDGKSTLIGRLLYDSKNLMEDQLEALERSADITGGGSINLANLTDGLRAEREQGITIDVAYRYFATPRRKFIVADTPGHVQYTRN